MSLILEISDFPWHVLGASKRPSSHAGQVDFYTARQITFLAQFPNVK